MYTIVDRISNGNSTGSGKVMRFSSLEERNAWYDKYNMGSVPKWYGIDNDYGKEKTALIKQEIALEEEAKLDKFITASNTVSKGVVVEEGATIAGTIEEGATLGGAIETVGTTLVGGASAVAGGAIAIGGFMVASTVINKINKAGQDQDSVRYEKSRNDTDSMSQYERSKRFMNNIK